jgi:5-methyltetrahydropteroyltriglutamate--homocysteine methyltransferase
MSIRTAPPFRGDHVGSLLRPPELLRARDDFAEGRIDAAQLRAVEDEAIRGVVRLQKDVGLKSVTDGEFRRRAWHMDFIYQIGGIRKSSERTLTLEFHDEKEIRSFDTPALEVYDKVRLEQTIFSAAFEFLKSVAFPDQTPKLSIPSPSMVHYRGGPALINRAVYPDVSEFWNDLTAAYAEEVKRLHELGCTYLQLDDTSLAYLNDPNQRKMVAGWGEDAEHLHLHYIRQFNKVVASKPAGMTITTHLCRGNFRSAWMSEGGYDYVAEALFGDLAVDGYFLEYDTDRSGSFAPLRFVPKDKVVVLGLVTTRSGALETKDFLKRRIEEATKYIDIDQLCLSPQCGSASTVDGNVLTYDEEIAKLRLVVETAEEVWGN